MRCFHFALTPILARVAGLGESVIPLLTRSGCLEIRSQAVKGLREYRSLRCFSEFGPGCLHNFRLPLVIRVKSEKVLPGLAPEAFAIVGFEQVERGVHLRIQSEPGTALHEVITLFRIFHQAAGFHFIRPGLDFNRRFRRAVGLQPDADVFIILCGLNGGFELLAVDALESEKQVVQRTVIMIFAERSRQAGAAFVNGPAGDRESGDAFTRTVRGLFGQIPGGNGGGHNFLRVVVKPMHPGEFAFREQLRLGLQAMLHLVPLQRTLVGITEVCLSGHFVR